MVKIVAALAALLLMAAAPPNCTGCNFNGADLHGRDFSNVNYTGANFARSNLQNADFDGARLTGVNFREADLRGAHFNGAECTGCNLSDAKLSPRGRAIFARCTGCNARNVDLAGFDLSGYDLAGDSFRGANLSDANLSGAAVCWHNTDEDDGTVVRREIACIDLRDATVTGADFSRARLCDRENGTRTCVAVDAATLREYTHSNLVGARLP